MIMHSHECGGAEKHTLLLMQELIKRGHRVTYAGPPDSWLRRQCDGSGVPSLSVAMHGTYDLASVAKLAGFAVKNRVDLLHGHCTRGAFYAGFAARLSGLPSLATAHSTNAYQNFHRVDRVIAVSEAVRRFLIEKSVPADRISLVYNGIPAPAPLPPETRAVMRRRLGLADSDKALCLVARFLSAKGHDLALEAVARLDDPRVRLFFVGKAEGEWLSQIVGRVRELKLERRVFFLGHQEKVYEILSAMDLYVAPSRREALSLAILEALSLGLPALVSDTGGNPEIIENGINGLLFPSENVVEMARAIKRALDCEPCAREFGEKGRETFRRRFTVSGMLEGTLNVYGRFLGNLAG
jgi:glycosyltransferase involved in cell wall biosynthesis